MILANTQGTEMNLFRRALEPGAVGNTHGSTSLKYGSSLMEIKVFLSNLSLWLAYTWEI